MLSQRKFGLSDLVHGETTASQLTLLIQRTSTWDFYLGWSEAFDATLL
jgi:hypothetical protein